LLRLALRAQPRSEASRSQAFAVGLVVAVPAAQGDVAGVGEKKWQRRRFNVAVAKYHVGFAKLTVKSYCFLSYYNSRITIANFWRCGFHL